LYKDIVSIYWLIVKKWSGVVTAVVTDRSLFCDKMKQDNNKSMLDQKESTFSIIRFVQDRFLYNSEVVSHLI